MTPPVEQPEEAAALRSAGSSWVRFWCGFMGWHPHRQRERFGFDGASIHARCRRCGYVGMEDSMGCLF